MIQDVWERERHRLSESLYERVVQGRDSVHYADLTLPLYPELFRESVRKHAQKIFRDHAPLKIALNDRYEVKTEMIRERIDDLRDVFINSTVFKSEEIQLLCDFAVAFQLDVIVRPGQTLLDSLYHKAEQRSHEDLQVVLQGFGESRPFIEKLLSAFRNLNLTKISKDKCEVITRAIERQVYEEMPVTAFIRDVTLMLEFEEIVTGTKPPGLTSPVLLAMLNERELSALVKELRHEADEWQVWTLDEIENTLQRYFVVGGYDQLSNDGEPEADDKVEERQEIEDEPDDIVEFAAYDDLGRVSPDSFQREQDQKSGQETAVKSNAHLKIKFADEPSASPERHQRPVFRHGHEPLSRANDRGGFSQNQEQFVVNRRDIESQPPGPYPPLYNLISPRDRRMLIRKIFRKDKEQYIEFIQRLEKLDSWKDAKATIDEELHIRQISPYSKEAVLLGDMVFSRYFYK